MFMKNKLNIFGASISKSSFDFEMELRFQNRASISKSNFDFEMENGASISKSSFDFEMEKSKFGFKIKDFVNMLARNHVKKCKSNH